MNKNTKLLIPAVIAAAALSACSSSSKGKPAAQPAPAPQQAAQQNQPFTPQTMKVDAIDSTKEVHYRCGQNGQDPLSVMYGFKGNEPVVAQVKYKNELTPTCSASSAPATILMPSGAETSHGWQVVPIWAISTKWMAIC